MVPSRTVTPCLVRRRLAKLMGIVGVRRTEAMVCRGSRRGASAAVAGAVLAWCVWGGFGMGQANAADEVPGGPRAEAWKRVQQALDEGKPKTAAEALAGVEQAAVAEKGWAEAARAIATRVLAATGDRPPDDPERPAGI